MLCATVLSSVALCMVSLPPGTFNPVPYISNPSKSSWSHYDLPSVGTTFFCQVIFAGFIGLDLSRGLSLNVARVFSVQNQCTIANYMIPVEHLNQYMHIPSEADLVIEDNRPPTNWPAVGKVEVQDLQMLVLCGISCTFQGGHQICIVGVC
ncbi:hypothetical protein MLD38_030338 [Melastoma candidum]|uniref:Uncharacterized protein n=1 Tax=Melastoma candidum TaxID=119954 RepID=A0ACB9MNF8_9MYRT|nr:hypothetical protein MLD38_030338 [Melastoma candidum]